jgi:hypothetical protein
MRPRRLLVICVATVGIAWTAAASAGVPVLIAPAPGAAVRVTPPKGFANGDVPFRWSIGYPDCPGPADIHSSWVEYREAGKGDFTATQRNGPFLGDGTFTTPGNVFPASKPVRYEWRVAWACGATEDFAGSQGRSPARSFTLLPLGTAVKPCTTLTGAAKTRCLALRRRAAALRRCATLAEARRPACRAAAQAAFRRATR